MLNEKMNFENRIVTIKPVDSKELHYEVRICT